MSAGAATVEAPAAASRWRRLISMSVSYALEDFLRLVDRRMAEKGRVKNITALRAKNGGVGPTAEIPGVSWRSRSTVTGRGRGRAGPGRARLQADASEERNRPTT